MAATHAVSGSSHASGPGLAGDLIARIGERVRRLVNPGWLLFQSSETAEEMLIARLGRVEIHRTTGGWSLETCVKGEPTRARETALRRLGNYVSGGNRSRMRLHAARPLVQAEEATGRWRIRVAVPGVDSSLVATTGRNGKVRFCATAAETLAVIRVPGRPTPLAVQHAETAIRHAIAPSRWEATAGAILRLYTLPAVPFLGRFEVALPVIERPTQSAMPAWMRHAVFGHSAAGQAASPSSPSAH
jgi:hypothetical protein